MHIKHKCMQLSLFRFLSIHLALSLSLLLFSFKEVSVRRAEGVSQLKIALFDDDDRIGSDRMMCDRKQENFTGKLTGKLTGRNIELEKISDILIYRI